MKQKLDYIPNDLVSLYDYERYAKERMSLNSLAYVCSAAGDELTYKSNEKSFQKFFLETKTLEDLSHSNTNIQLFGKTYETPIFIAPVAYQKLVDIDGEIATAQAANAMNSCMIVSSFSSSTFDDIIWQFLLYKAIPLIT